MSTVIFSSGQVHCKLSSKMSHWLGIFSTSMQRERREDIQRFLGGGGGGGGGGYFGVGREIFKL